MAEIHSGQGLSALTQLRMQPFIFMIGDSTIKERGSIYQAGDWLF